MNSSAVDARVVIAVEKILDAGCVIYSEKLDNMFHVLIGVPFAMAAIGIDVIDAETGESFSGWGATFPEAFQDAYRQLPEREHSAAA